MALPQRLRGALVAALLCVTVVSAAAQPQSPVDSPSRSLDRQGEAFMREGQYDDALSAFGKALALEPNNARTLLLSAQVNWLASGAQAKAPAVDLLRIPLERQDFSRIVLSGRFFRLIAISVSG